jgi:hypothetical protein
MSRGKIRLGLALATKVQLEAQLTALKKQNPFGDDLNSPSHIELNHVVIGLLLAQPIQCAYQRAKTPEVSFTLIDKAFLVDLLLVVFWITALFVGAARSGAGASG